MERMIAAITDGGVNGDYLLDIGVEGKDNVPARGKYLLWQLDTFCHVERNADPIVRKNFSLSRPVINGLYFIQETIRVENPGNWLSNLLYFKPDLTRNGTYPVLKDFRGISSKILKYG